MSVEDDIEKIKEKGDMTRSEFVRHLCFSFSLLCLCYSSCQKEGKIKDLYSEIWYLKTEINELNARVTKITPASKPE